LHEVFDYDHGEIATMLERDPAAIRQLVHRARAHVRERRPRYAPSREAHAAMLQRFAAACASGDMRGLTQLLTKEVVATADGGGRVSAARVPVRGSDAVARYLIGLARKGAAGLQVDLVEVNAWPALQLTMADGARVLIAIETDGAEVFAVHLLVNPDKLAAWVTG
jgi:RNA polymerase sigma-70 factor, ECF subfamily